MNTIWTCFTISLSDSVLQKKKLKNKELLQMRSILITELTIFCSRNIAYGNCIPLVLFHLLNSNIIRLKVLVS